ncbi:MAG: hypothetical protein ABIH23_16870 [bacterium]
MYEKKPWYHFGFGWDKEDQRRLDEWHKQHPRRDNGYADNGLAGVGILIFIIAGIALVIGLAITEN